MLDHPDPVPTGLITALLARSGVRPGEVGERIGPSPRQMRELTEGRGLFSPYKLKRVADLTGVPEERIRAVQGLITELTEAVRLRPGTHVAHPRLGEVEILTAGAEVSIRTRDGQIIDGVHPVSFAGADLLDRFGLSPLQDGADPEPTREPDITSPDTEPAKGNSVMRSRAPANPSGRSKPEAEPAPEPVGSAPQHARGGPEAPPRSPGGGSGGVPHELIRDLVRRSGRSMAALSRALGKDTSFLSGVLTRGRRMPQEMLEPFTRLCEGPLSPAAEKHPRPTPPVEVTRKVSRETDGQAIHETAPTSEGPIATDPAPLGTAPDLACIILEPLLPETARAGRGPAQRRASAGPVVSPQPAERHTAAAMIEVIIEGVCRVRVPAGFDMEAAARLIRSVSSGGSSGQIGTAG